MTRGNNESDLIARFQKGDPEAFADLYRMYSKRLYLNLTRLVKSEQIAEEILQDIFISIWEKRANLTIRGDFGSYLFGVSLNKIADWFRKVRRDQILFNRIRSIATDAHSYIEEDIVKKEGSKILHDAIATLPPQRRQVFELCKLQGRSYIEVSHSMGISPSTINDHIVKATKTIREYLNAHHVYSTSLLAIAVLRTFDSL